MKQAKLHSSRNGLCLGATTLIVTQTQSSKPVLATMTICWRRVIWSLGFANPSSGSRLAVPRDTDRRSYAFLLKSSDIVVVT